MIDTSDALATSVHPAIVWSYSGDIEIVRYLCKMGSNCPNRAGCFHCPKM